MCSHSQFVGCKDEASRISNAVAGCGNAIAAALAARGDSRNGEKERKKERKKERERERSYHRGSRHVHSSQFCRAALGIAAKLHLATFCTSADRSFDPVPLSHSGASPGLVRGQICLVTVKLPNPTIGPCHA